jgi:hypothetical protein
MPRGVSKYLFRVLHPVCGTQTIAKDSHMQVKDSARPRLTSRGFIVVVHPIHVYSPSSAPPPPYSSLGMYVPCPHRASALCVVGCSMSLSCRLRWCLTGEVAGEYWRVLRRIHGLSTKKKVAIRALPSGRVSEIATIRKKWSRVSDLKWGAITC